MSQLGFDQHPQPARARPSDPWTSHAAARSLPTEKLRESQRAILECFEIFGPMHHQRLVARYEREYVFLHWPMQSESGLRTRTSELVKAGLLQDSGSIVVLPSNRKSIVWQINAAQERML